MKTTSFHIPSRWRVEGDIGDVYAILTNPVDFVRWWPAVYLAVEELRPGDDEGLGRIVRLRTKGWLPYTLDWQAEAVDLQKPERVVIRAWGDLVGTGEWRLKQVDQWVEVDYLWTVHATKPWMRYLAFVLRPVFVANHRWAMAQGQRGLTEEIAQLNRYQ